MKIPSTSAPFVLLGSDGKEYAAQDRGMLGVWWGQGAVNEASKIWSTEAQKWLTLKELGITKKRSVVVCTGDIARAYEILEPVFAFVARDKPAFGPIDFPGAMSEATDRLAGAAAAMGADGVVWTRYTHEWAGQLGGFAVLASGTAVKFH